jgi:uncharacterized membrane protein
VANHAANTPDIMAKKHQKTVTPEVAPQDFLSAEKRAAKKAAVLGEPHNPRRTGAVPLIIISVGALVALGIVGSYYTKNRTSPKPLVLANTPVPLTDSVPPAAEVVTYAESLFFDGVAKFYTYQHGNTTIKYFMVRSPDGVLRAAFDACDVCWPAGKGYTQEGDQMVCNNCGKRFPLNKIGEVYGGCNPAPLPSKIENLQVVIAIKDILEGQRYFDRSQANPS